MTDRNDDTVPLPPEPAQAGSAPSAQDTDSPAATGAAVPPAYAAAPGPGQGGSAPLTPPAYEAASAAAGGYSSGGAGGGAGAVPPGAAPTGPSDGARIGARALAITVSVIGGLGFVLAGSGLAYAAVRDASRPAPETAVVGTDQIDGIRAIDAGVPAGSLRIQFEDRDDIALDYSSGRGAWLFEVSGDTLEVAGPNRDFGDFRWFDGFGDDTRATLLLPESLAGVDLRIDMDAGAVVAEGDFGDIDYDIDAGSLEIEGSAARVTGDMSAGRSVLELADVAEASFEVSAGSFYADFTGAAPDAVSIDVTAGSFEMQLPEESYAVSISREAGSVDSNLREDSSSDHAVDVQVAAGYVSLYAG